LKEEEKEPEEKENSRAPDNNALRLTLLMLSVCKKAKKKLARSC
jgi:hypothetical protein